MVTRAGNARGGVARGAGHDASEVGSANSPAGVVADESADVGRRKFATTCGTVLGGNNDRMVHSAALGARNAVAAAGGHEGDAAGAGGIRVGNMEEGLRYTCLTEDG